MGIEPISLMEPLLLPDGLAERPQLMDLVLELTHQSTELKSALPSAIQSSLAATVRAMNCYYSNLIEGHNTHPIAIEQALQGNYELDPKKRDLQLEAKAHIEVQTWIDQGGLNGSEFSIENIGDIHKRFYEKLPEDLCWSEDPKTHKKIRIVPGKMREDGVKVGAHVGIHPDSVSAFLKRYQHVYSSLGKSESLLALAGAHHRFLWIHPFLDGNGRVARFISYATILKHLDTGGIWSISRGLARHVEKYKMHLSHCDMTRRNDLDGRGNLSQEALVQFTRFFLEVCLDQVTFMKTLLQPEQLRTRILIWAKEEIELKHIPAQSVRILERILYRGEISRRELTEMVDLTERQTLRILKNLIDQGILMTATSKSPIQLAFPTQWAHRWMPGLFPEPSMA